MKGSSGVKGVESSGVKGVKCRSRVQGVGFMVSRLRVRVQGAGCRVSDVGCKMVPGPLKMPLDPVRRISPSDPRVPGRLPSPVPGRESVPSPSPTNSESPCETLLGGGCKASKGGHDTLTRESCPQVTGLLWGSRFASSFFASPGRLPSLVSGRECAPSPRETPRPRAKPCWVEGVRRRKKVATPLLGSHGSR